MNALLHRIGRNDLRRHPLQTALAVVGVAIAVAVVVAVDLANHSAREAMRVSLAAVTGQTTHQVVGGPKGLDEAVYTRLRTELGVRQAAPVIEVGVSAHDSGRPLTLLGLDAFAEGPFERPLGDANALGEAFNPLLLGTNSVAVSVSEAQRLGVSQGETLALNILGQTREVEIVALLPDADDRGRGLLLADIAVAQALAGRLGRIDRIDLMISDARAQTLARQLGAGARIVPAAANANAVLEMSRAFRINLTALSLLAVVVGAFLVFNTLSFLAVRRRVTIGVLRAMGVDQRSVLWHVLADALRIGALGTVLGLGLGFALAHGLVGLVLQTINDVYFQRAAGDLVLSGWSLAAGVAVGLLGSAVAALGPAREAAATPPRAALSRADLETRARRLTRQAAILGGLCGVSGGAVIALTQGLIAAFVGLFAIILGAAFLAPAVMMAFGALLRPLARGRPMAGLIIEGAVASLSRTGIAVAALSVAVAAVIGVAVMIDSFRGSVINWLEGSLAADFYISAPAGLSDAEANGLNALPDVRFVSRSRWYTLAGDDGPITLWGLEMPANQPLPINLKRGDPEQAIQAFRNDRAVLVSEPFAARRAIEPGASLSLPVGGTRVTVQVAGVYRDYASPTGVVLMRRALYQRLYQDAQLDGLGVHHAADIDRAALQQRLEQALTGVPGARVTDNAEIFRQSLAIFDRTFAITEVLRWLAGLVAFVGVISALMALHLDRLREFAILRAIGLSRVRLAGVIGGQSGLLGLAAGLWSIPLGLALAVLLVFVINQRAYGWQMGFSLSVNPLIEGVVLAVIAAGLAALYPAWRAARLSVSEGLKGE